MRVRIVKDERWPDYTAYPADDDGTADYVLDVPPEKLQEWQDAARRYEDSQEEIERLCKRPDGEGST